MIDRKTVWKIAAGVAVVVCLLIYFLNLGGNSFAYKVDPMPSGASQSFLPNSFWTALAAISALSILVERFIEVLLKASGSHPTPIPNTENPSQLVKPDIAPTAALVGIILGVIISASGIRILDSLVVVQSCGVTPPAQAAALACASYWGEFFFNFSDIILTAGLLAGGAHTLHPYLNALADLGVRLKNAASGTQTPVVTDQASSIVVNTHLYKKLAEELKPTS